MDVARRIWNWLGLTAPIEERAYAASRNMFVLTLIAPVVLVFALMLNFCIFTGTECPVNGFDRAAYENPATTMRFRIFLPLDFLMVLALFVYAILYRRRNWRHPRSAAIASMLFSLAVVMLWGVAEAGTPNSTQLLIFASLQFLVAGLLVFSPLASLLYFAATFWMFGAMLVANGYFISAQLRGHLVYLTFLDTVVSWVVYGLHRQSVLREQSISDLSRRDELTGAKNRHYLRDDFPAFVGHAVFVMFCDIDNFKHFNDDYSHAEGDLLLKHFFQALREAFGDECVYRYGGDEFLVVSPEFGEEEFLDKVEKAREQLRLVQLDGRPAGLTFSGGYVWGTVPHEDAGRAMLHAADERLLTAKRRGKDRVEGVPMNVPYR